MRTFLLFFLAISSLQASDLQLKQVMTDQEMESMGLHRATPQQKAALERWLTKWTQDVIAQAPTYHPGDSLSLWISSWPAYAQPKINKESPDAIKTRKAANSVIFRNYNGNIIELKDGSKWEIKAFEVPTTKYWQRDDRIRVEKKSEDLYHPYFLINETRSTQAMAKELVRASTTGQRSEDKPSYFANSKQIIQKEADGSRIELEDKTAWLIEPLSLDIAMKWKLRDRVKVENNNDFLYKYTITNLDSGESVRANKTK